MCEAKIRQCIGREKIQNSFGLCKRGLQGTEGGPIKNRIAISLSLSHSAARAFSFPTFESNAIILGFGDCKINRRKFGQRLEFAQFRHCLCKHDGCSSLEEIHSYLSNEIRKVPKGGSFSLDKEARYRFGKIPRHLGNHIKQSFLEKVLQLISAKHRSFLHNSSSRPSQTGARKNQFLNRTANLQRTILDKRSQGECKSYESSKLNPAYDDKVKLIRNFLEQLNVMYRERIYREQSIRPASRGILMAEYSW